MTKKSIIISGITFLLIACCIAVVLLMGQTKKNDLQYCQEYIWGQAGIVGNVNVQEYAVIHEDFAIGANKYGFAVFKEPEKALNTLKEL